MLNTIIELLKMGPIEFILGLIILFFPLMVSVTVHEWAHGITAYKFGDPTPKLQGRLTLNPFAHIDPAGLIMLIIVGIGWAKPVIINTENIHGRFKLLMVALAGPLSNFIMALVLSLLMVSIIKVSEINNFAEIGIIAKILFSQIILVNLMLGIFNLIPIPPLDGSNVLLQLMPERIAQYYGRLSTIGMPILLVIFFFFKGFSWIYTAAKFLMIELLKLYGTIL